MNVEVTTKKVTISPDYCEEIKEKAANCERFNHQITACHVTIDNQHIKKGVSVVYTLTNHTVSAHADAENIGKALDLALDKASRQLKKLNQKRKNHKHNKDEIISAVVEE